MPGVLRVLLVEDSEDDAALLVHELRKGGYRPQSQRVDSAVDLAEALAQDNWDLVITDHNLPAFSSAAALRMVKDSGLDMKAMDPDRCGVIVGSGIGGLGELEKEHLKLIERGPDRVSPFCVPKLMVNAASANISIS